MALGGKEHVDQKTSEEQMDNKGTEYQQMSWVGETAHTGGDHFFGSQFDLFYLLNKTCFEKANSFKNNCSRNKLFMSPHPIPKSKTTHTHPHPHAQSQAQTHTHSLSLTHTHTHACTHARTHARSLTRTHARTHAHTHNTHILSLLSLMSHSFSASHRNTGTRTHSLSSLFDSLLLYLS